MANTTTWFIGSYRDLPAQTVLINGAPKIIPAGDYYLFDDNATLSLLAQVRAAIVAGGYGLASAVILKNRRIRISTGAGVFAVTWPAGGLLRDLLGFTGNLAGASTYTATNVSPLLWGPGIGRAESPSMAPLGSLGHKRLQTFQSVSAYDGSVHSVSHGSGRVYNSFWFLNVEAARYQTPAELGGSWSMFFENVCALGASFNAWREVDEDGTTDTATLVTKLGPYVYSPSGRGGMDWSFTRSAKHFQYTDQRYDLTIPVHVVPEYDNA